MITFIIIVRKIGYIYTKYYGVGVGLKEGKMESNTGENAYKRFSNVGGVG